MVLGFKTTRLPECPNYYFNTFEFLVFIQILRFAIYSLFIEFFISGAFIYLHSDKADKQVRHELKTK